MLLSNFHEAVWSMMHQCRRADMLKGYIKGSVIGLDVEAFSCGGRDPGWLGPL